MENLDRYAARFLEFFQEFRRARGLRRGRLGTTFMNRRTFIQSSTIAMASGMTALGANDRINVAVIGVRSRGRDHITSYSKLPEARIAAVCDIDQAQIERAVAFTDKLTGSKPRKTYQDIRKLLEDKDIDAVSIATCNHWHALATVWACQAGKDVYVEKPASHEIWEGRKMVEAARKYNRMVQVGMQSRTTAAQDEGHAVAAGGRHRQGLSGEGPVLQAAQIHRPSVRRPGSAGRGLRHLAGPGGDAALQSEPLPLQLALVLGHGQWRHRQPGCTRDGHLPLGAEQGHAARAGGFRRRKIRVQRRSGDAQHAARHVQVSTIASSYSKCAAC